MPNLDRKGPEGLGSKTGMKLGKCRKTKFDETEISTNRPFGKGRRKRCTTSKIIKID
jgi:hypothetical protein